MPIDQYRAIGDWNDIQGYFLSSNKIEKRGKTLVEVPTFEGKRTEINYVNTTVNLETSQYIIHSERAVQKIRQKWERVPYKFNFFFLNAQKDNSRPFFSTGVWTRQNFGYKLPYFKNIHMKHKKELTFTNDAINVVYTNNITNTNNYRPMTAWIMAHRLEHIFLSSDYTVCSALMAELSTLICRTINIYNPAYSENQVTDLRNFYNVSNTNVRILYEFVYKVFTMRSARNKNISSVFDYNAELFAQWLLTGSIKFNTVPKSIITVASAKSQFDDREKCIVHEISELQQKLLTAEWNRLAVKLGEYYDILMQDSIGKVLCW